MTRNTVPESGWPAPEAVRQQAGHLGRVKPVIDLADPEPRRAGRYRQILTPSTSTQPGPAGLLAGLGDGPGDGLDVVGDGRGVGPATTVGTGAGLPDVSGVGPWPAVAGWPAFTRVPGFRGPGPGTAPGPACEPVPGPGPPGRAGPAPAGEAAGRIVSRID
jgi:hypothetical protein